MATVDDVALWMKSELNNQNRLYQEVAVYEINKRFGNAFVYTNDNGNLAIDKKVLAKFKKLTADTAIWERGEKAWRKRESYDNPGRQQD
ncbi:MULTISPECIES: hypothetical protein [unclassified Tatumella]|uniref:DUF6953 family protein n=1 Tax=unclassified Tatumella TaxID=2649542 RepID=UPI001BAEDD3F|nr:MULTISPECIES: hypothetical protein [unclassified Tatumella]MBS0877978.1 hypothetical protein [Tatumella sp. JGM82]MBS0891299.1 hypothetical protein [Tatumella sp. JGM94]MBS0902678.1 hypothetical protein [Tatumella sp. JGM100]